MTKRRRVPATSTAAGIKRLLLILGALCVAGIALTITPASADPNNENCNPGNDCTGFERNAYDVREGRKFVTLKVLAAWCCPTAQGEIDYETVDGSAVAGKDYERTAGTLTYAANGAGLIRVPIFDDTSSEGEEQFVVRLTEFRGTFVVRGYETAVVTVRERSPEEIENESFWANRSSQPEVLRTDTAPPLAAGRPARPASSASGSPSQASPVLDEPALTDARDQPRTDRSAGKKTAAPVTARKGGDRPSSPLLPLILACLLFATVAIPLPAKALRQRRTATGAQPKRETI